MCGRPSELSCRRKPSGKLSAEHDKEAPTEGRRRPSRQLQKRGLPLLWGHRTDMAFCGVAQPHWRVQGFSMTEPDALSDGYLTRKDLAQLLHIRVERLRLWERRGLI